MMTVDEAILHLRTDPQYSTFIRDAYLADNITESAERFKGSPEFSEVQRLLGSKVHEGVVLDLGAGNGIASYAFAASGARLVFALEPNPSDEIGRGAISLVTTGLDVEVIDGCGEDIPLPDEEVDIVYARQVLHHTRDLFRVMHECARVLKNGGTFVACREHVVDDTKQMKIFLDTHPIHRLAGGENAFTLNTYIEAIRSAGLELREAFGHLDTVINSFPRVRTPDELRQLPQIALKRRFGVIGGAASRFPGVDAIVWALLKRPTPGRMYTFLATKP